MHPTLWSPTISAADRISALSAGSLMIAGSSAVALPLLATNFADPAVDVVLVALSIVAGVGAVAAGVWRQRIRALPLELAGHACRGYVGGQVAYRFRVRLGRNRMLSKASATVRFIAEDRTIELEAIPDKLALAVGPWTLVVVDVERQCDGPGRFEVEVTAHEGERRWSASATYDSASLHTGRFGGDAQVIGGALVLNADLWDAVVSSDDGQVSAG